MPKAREELGVRCRQPGDEIDCSWRVVVPNTGRCKGKRELVHWATFSKEWGKESEIDQLLGPNSRPAGMGPRPRRKDRIEEGGFLGADRGARRPDPIDRDRLSIGQPNHSERCKGRHHSCGFGPSTALRRGVTIGQNW